MSFLGSLVAKALERWQATIAQRFVIAAASGLIAGESLAIATALTTMTLAGMSALSVQAGNETAPGQNVSRRVAALANSNRADKVDVIVVYKSQPGKSEKPAKLPTQAAANGLYDGTGVTVAVLDSGVGDHQDINVSARSGCALPTGGGIGSFLDEFSTTLTGVLLLDRSYRGGLRQARCGGPRRTPRRADE